MARIEELKILFYYLSLRFSIKFILFLELIFRLCVGLLPDVCFEIYYDAYSAILKLVRLIYFKSKNSHRLSDTIINVTLAIPHYMDISNSFKIYLLFDNQEDALFNIIKFCQLYANIIEQPYCILMMAYNHDKQIKYQFVNIKTKKIINPDSSECSPLYNVCPL